MAQAHPVRDSGPVQPGSGGHGDHVEHASHPGARTYLFIFFILAVVTALEVAVAVEPLRSIVPQLPALLSMGVIKGVLIVAFYMHLKTDSRIFTGFFAIGLILAVAMILSFLALFFAHYREPFDEVSWRAQQQQQGTQPGQQVGGMGGGN